MTEISFLFLIFAAVSLLMGGLIAWSWALLGRAPYLAAWAGANILIGVARLISAFAEALPRAVVLLPGTAMLLTAVALLWAGARLLREAAAPAWLVLAPGLLWFTACLWPSFYASLPAQLLASALTAALISLLFAWEMVRFRSHGLARVLAILVAIMAVLYALSHLSRLVTTLAPDTLALTAPNILTGGPLFLTIGFLTIALGYIQNAERAARIQAQALLRAAELRAETAGREAAAQRAGREEMERLHGALPAGIFHGFVRADGSIGRLYRAGDLPAVLGWSRAELASMETLEAISDFGDTTLPELVAGVLRAGTGSWDWKLRQPDGSWAWMRTHALRFHGANGARDEFVGYTFNITREREAEARALVVARLASLGEMAAGLAHELRQPLQSVSLAAEAAQIVARRKSADHLDAQLELVVTQAHQASAMMDHLRRFARGADAQAPVEEVRLDLAVRDAVSLAGDALRRAEITVETLCDAPAPSVQGQALAIEQILTNLLLHARDAMMETALPAPRRLEIAARNGTDGTASLIVTIPRACASAALPSSKPSSAARPADPGTGLGLSICQSLVSAMNGRLLATQDADGTAFAVTLPAMAASA